MRTSIIKLGTLCLFLLLGLPGRPNDPVPDAEPAGARSRHYQQAYLEMSAMLDGSSALSIKRAVFLAEWAYLDGALNYDDYCYGIDTAVGFLQRFIKVNGLDAYKTGRNLALTEYFFRPFSGNGRKPFTYNFNDTGGEQEFTNQFVTKVMRTHTGQCRSLPMYYKVLAEALGAEAYIAYAPAHVFIRYRNEDNMYPEEWVNVELTTHQITPESFYKEHFEISDKAIANKVYLHPLTDRETVAAQLADLAFGYTKKFGLYDDFTRRCTEKSLEYYPHHPNAIIILGKSIETVLAEHLKHNGYIEDDYARQLDERSQSLYERLKSLGWEEMSEGLYEKLEKGNEQGKRMQATIAK